MSQNSQVPGRPARPGATQGSVRDVRERMERGNMMDPRRRPPPPCQSDSPPRSVPISRPAPMPQWPLTNDVKHDSPSSSQWIPEKSAPRRPPRPSYVPSILDASKIQDHTPAFEYRQQQAQPAMQYTLDYHNPHHHQQQQQQQQQRHWDPNYSPSPLDANMPGSGFSGNSTSSRPLTTSSYGSIPDFPEPSTPGAKQAFAPSQMLSLPPQQQPRRSTGPPPTARRGVSSYYSHASFVAPILEEAPESPKLSRGHRGPQHGSYASSHVIPRSWADRPSAYYAAGYPEEDEEDEDDDNDDDDIGERESRASDHDESTGLVRKASLGRQFRPTLTTVRSSTSSSLDDPKSSAVPNIPAYFHPNVAKIDNASPYTGKDGHSRSADTGVAAGSDSSQSTGPSLLTSGSNSSDPVKQIMGGLQKGGAIEKGVAPPAVAQQTRKPLRLDIEAVHEAEARGSLTSLTDLIRRATKARTNLERGRTASRLGMLDFGSSSNPNLLLEKMGGNHGRNSDSLSGILSSFPPPAQTPQGERANSSWPAPFANSDCRGVRTAEQNEKNGTKRPVRRCCGLPLWVFLMLLLLLALFIAAAVTVPIVLIVLPRMRDQNNNAADLTKCASMHPCQNGGQSVVSSNSCRCVCTGGFTGSSCTVPPDSDCTSSDVGSIKHATMGNSVPRLISSASAFGISLNSTALLSTFAAANVSCTDEEALITFNGQTQRRAVPMPWPPTITARSFLDKAVASAAPSAVTSNGIILDSAAGTPIATAQTVTGSAAPSASAQPSSVTSSKDNSASAKDLDFARMAVLWILQETQQLDVAVSTQQTLKSKLSGDFTAETINVRNAVKVDFLQRKVTVNGVTVGGST